MEFYQKQFAKEITIIAWIGLIVSFISIVFDNFTNSLRYPTWISWLNGLMLLLIVALILLNKLSIIKIQDAFLIFVYLFTLNIYIPGFVGNIDLRLEILNTFSNLGSCFIYVFLVVVLGKSKHVLWLGLLNIICIYAISFYGLYSLGEKIKFDSIIVVMFLFTAIFLYYVFQLIEKTIIESNLNKEKILEQEKEILYLKIEEEKKRSSYFSMTQSEYESFINSIISEISEILLIRDDEEKRDSLIKLKKFCLMKEYKNQNSENVKIYKEPDYDFFIKLKQVSSELTHKELLICSMLRFKLSSKEIAENLNMSIETVKWYRKRIKKKIKTDKNISEFLSSI